MMSHQTRKKFLVEGLETRTLLAADLGLAGPMGPEPQGVEVNPAATAQLHHDGPIVCFDGSVMEMAFDVENGAGANDNSTIDQPTGPTSEVDPLDPEVSTGTNDAGNPTAANDDINPVGPVRFTSATNAGDPTAADDDGINPLGPDRYTSTTDAVTATEAENDSIGPWSPDVEVHETDFGGQTDRMIAVDDVLAAYGSTDR
jgi:hypothetical protein